MFHRLVVRLFHVTEFFPEQSHDPLFADLLEEEKRAFLEEFGRASPVDAPLQVPPYAEIEDIHEERRRPHFAAHLLELFEKVQVGEPVPPGIDVSRHADDRPVAVAPRLLVDRRRLEAGDTALRGLQDVPALHRVLQVSEVILLDCIHCSLHALVGPQPIHGLDQEIDRRKAAPEPVSSLHTEEINHLRRRRGYYVEPIDPDPFENQPVARPVLGEEARDRRSGEEEDGIGSIPGQGLCEGDEIACENGVRMTLFAGAVLLSFSE